jgi:hypothetical protein
LRANRTAGRIELSPLAQVLVDIAFRVRPPEALLDVLAGIEPPRIRK